MKDRSLNFRVVKAIFALPVTVCVLIPAILLYLSGWQWGDIIRNICWFQF